MKQQVFIYLILNYILILKITIFLSLFKAYKCIVWRIILPKFAQISLFEMSVYLNKKKHCNADKYKFLIIRLSSIGDVVLTSPIIRCLRRAYPNAQIDYLIKSGFKQVLEAHPDIDNLMVYNDKDVPQTLHELAEKHYTHIIDLHHNLRTLKIKRYLVNATAYSFPKLNIQKWLYVNFKWASLMPDVSIVSRYFEAVAPLGVTNDGEGLDYFIPKASETKLEDVPMSHWAGYVACVLGGSKGTKQLPTSKWIEFAQQCDLPLIMLGGPDDVAQGELIAQSKSDNSIYNACGKFKLNESADLVRRAKVVVSNDTGLMHIAAAFKKPIVSLWGNTTPQLGMFPYYGANNLKTTISPKNTIVEVKGLSCRPCSKIGYEDCPKKHFKCMNDILVPDMVAAVYKYWKEK
jgi:ADP-heptose:LPS heptosyltransferase